MRFLLTRRWVLFFATVVVLAFVAYLLGQWQFHRLDERRVTNKITATNLAGAPVPASQVLSTRHGPSKQDEWRRVTVTGRWDDSRSIVLKYQTRDGSAGVDVATPLLTAGGTAALVDRGWMGTSNVGSIRPKLPRVTAGVVTVTGFVRADATGRAANVEQLSTRALSGDNVSKVVDYPMYRGFLDLDTQSPPAVTRLGRTEKPDDTSEGPHFFYGLQWYFFGLLALFGFCYLAYDERRLARVARAQADAQEQRRTRATEPSGPDGATASAADRRPPAASHR